MTVEFVSPLFHVFLACAKSPVSSRELQALLHKSQPSISESLTLLEKEGLIESVRAGSRRFYSVTDKGLEVLGNLVTEISKAFNKGDTYGS